MADDDEEAALLAAIAADPEDAQAREVYADWLDKRGDIRGEFLRLEAHLHAIPPRLAMLTAHIDPLWLRKVGRTYDVVIVEAGPNKIGVIKLVRELTGKGLRDSKDLVDAVAHEPSRIATNLDRDAAERIVDHFQETGATVRVVPHGSTKFRVPEARGVMVTLASVLPEHKRNAIALVRAVQGCGLRDAFRLVEKVLAGTPEMLVTGVTVDRAGELVAMFTPVGSVTCTPA